MPGLNETIPGNTGFSYAVYVFDEYMDEFPTLPRAKREARELARTRPGETVSITKYRAAYIVREKKL